MLLDRLDDETVLARVRPSVRARWRRYVPPASLLLLGLVLLVQPGPLVDPLMDLQLTRLGALLVLGGAVLALAVAGVKLLGLPPVPTLGWGALGLSLGANLLSPTWIGLGPAGVALAWTAAIEVLRLQSGLTLTDARVLFPRPFRRAVGFAFDEVRVVHTAKSDQPAGPVILETAHGTVTAGDLPGHTSLAERVRARVDAPSLTADVASVAEARARIEALLEGRPAGTPRA